VGTVLDGEARTAAEGLRVELWETKADEPLGVATTQPNGNFEIEIDVDEFRRRYERRRPRFLVRVFHEDLEITDPANATEFTLVREPARVLVPVDLTPVVLGTFWRKLRGPHLLPTAPDASPHGYELEIVENPFAARTLGGLGFAVEVKGDGELSDDWVLVIPYRDEQMTGVETNSVRLFTPGRPESLEPLWNSSVNPEGKFIWANIRRPGLYVPLGKPRDRLVLAAVEELARMRKRLGPEVQPQELNRELVDRAFRPFRDLPPEQLDELRFELTNFEVQTRAAPVDPTDVRLGNDGVIQPFPLPGDVGAREFYERVRQMDIPPTGLPEEQLFFPPDELTLPDVPWEMRPGPVPDPPVPTPDPDAPLPIPWPRRPISSRRGFAR
jgi:hypothetical protein